MNRLKIAMFAVLVTGSAVALAAQGEAVDKATPSSKSGKTDVTVTGCVAAGTQAGHFVLTDAAAVPAATPSTTGTSGAAAADAPAVMASPTSYDLKGGNLKPHVGHKVEVTGTTWQNAAAHGAEATTAAPATPSPDAAAATSTPGATLEVKSVKMLSTSCS